MSSLIGPGYGRELAHNRLPISPMTLTREATDATAPVVSYYQEQRKKKWPAGGYSLRGVKDHGGSTTY